MSKTGLVIVRCCIYPHAPHSDTPVVQKDVELYEGKHVDSERRSHSCSLSIFCEGRLSPCLLGSFAFLGGSQGTNDRMTDSVR